jgi:hypothetical protein
VREEPVRLINFIYLCLKQLEEAILKLDDNIPNSKKRLQLNFFLHILSKLGFGVTRLLEDLNPTYCLDNASNSSKIFPLNNVKAPSVLIRMGLVKRLFKPIVSGSDNLFGRKLITSEIGR